MFGDNKLGELAKKVTGLNNEILAMKTLIFCNSIYPLRAFKLIKERIDYYNENHKNSQYNIGDWGTLDLNIDEIRFRDALHNNKDPKLEEIQQFCAPIRNLEFKFSKFEKLIENGVLDCEVSGNRNGAYIIKLSMQTKEPSEKDGLFMQNFSPEDFNEENK